MRLGVIGLGNIGGHVAANLIEDGHEVNVYDSEKSRTESLADAGAIVSSGAEAVAQRSEISFISLPTPAIMREVAQAWLEASNPGAILVDLSTNAPSTVREVGAQLAAAGRHLLEAPLTGGAIGARARALVFMVGGEEQAYERCRPILEQLGRANFYLGDLGRGNTAKLVNSLLAFTSTWVSLEGLTLASKAGIDLRSMIEIVRTGGAGNFYIDRMVEGINRRGGPAQFALELAAKDAGLIKALAEELEVSAPVASEIQKVFAAASQAGLGERDWSDIVEWMEQQSNTKLEL